jgi:hypothetical protein
MEKNKTNRNDYFHFPNPGLQAYFLHVREGQPEIYSTPLITKGDDKLSNEKKLSRLRKIMQRWTPHLEKLKNEWPSLYEFEKDLEAKVGPMSVMKPLSERTDDIKAYYEGVLLPAEPISKEAVLAACNKFKPAKGIRLRSEQKTVDLMKKSTNSGNPFYTKRKLVVKKTVPVTVSGKVMILNGNDEWLYCAIIGWRGQEGGPDVDDVKQRVVWMFPFGINIKELQVYQPSIEVFQRFNLVPAWVSMDNVDEQITKMFDTKGVNDDVVCTDFSKFDQHFNGRMQECAKAILEYLLQNNSESHSWLETIYPIKYNIPLAVDTNECYFGAHGMGSGSGGTNFDETLSHTALQFEAAMTAGKKLNPYSQCLGDDGVLTYPGIKVDDVIRSYSRHGLEMNASKQYVSKQDCVYLRRWHHVNYRVNGVCVGVYATARALGRLCMQERYYEPEEWGPKMVALRELSIIENCKHHPLFEEFADFCMELDRYRLGLDIEGFLDNIDKIAQEATELMPDFLGYTKSLAKDSAKGLSEWRIVKYLKSKR